MLYKMQCNIIIIWANKVTECRKQHHHISSHVTEVSSYVIYFCEDARMEVYLDLLLGERCFVIFYNHEDRQKALCALKVKSICIMVLNCHCHFFPLHLPFCFGCSTFLNIDFALLYACKHQVQALLRLMSFISVEMF